MAKVLALHYGDGALPKLLESELKGIQEKVLEALKKPEYSGVEHKGTWVDDRGIGMCDWEAPGAEAVKRLFDEVIKAPYSEIIEVKQVLPVK